MKPHHLILALIGMLGCEPLCGMGSLPMGSATPPQSGIRGMAVVLIPEEKRQLIGLKLGAIERRPLAREIRTSARVVADETRLWRVTTKIEGWVEKLFVAYTGQWVARGDPLLSIYSPELLSAQAEYIAALQARDRSARRREGEAPAEPAPPGGSASRGSLRTARTPSLPGQEYAPSEPNITESLVRAARRRLELWDLSPGQLDRIAQTRMVQRALTLHAPASGVVLERNVLAGEKIGPGNSLMVIADLSVVWADADIYQSDLPFVKEGMPLQMTLPYWPGKAFGGKVIFVSPTVDPASRTLRARLEIPNPEQLLKPGMFGDARLSYSLGEKLSIPASAVMFGGERTYAFRDLGDGHLVPVPITLGLRSGDFYELLGGLSEGDKVVASANFLVDSESNLKSGMESMGGMHAPEPGPVPRKQPTPHVHPGHAGLPGPALAGDEGRASAPERL